MSRPRLILPKRMRKPALTTHAFYRADGSMFGVHTVPANVATLQMPDYTAGHDAANTNGPHEVPVLEFVRAKIATNMRHGDNAQQVGFVVFIERRI